MATVFPGNKNGAEGNTMRFYSGLRVHLSTHRTGSALGRTVIMCALM